MKQKTLWRGVFNYNHFIEKPLYRAAYTQRQAWKIMCDEIARKHGVHSSHVYAIFDGSKQNYEILPEVVWKELEDGSV